VWKIAEAMESLSPEAKLLYDMLKSETTEIHEAKFASYKKEMLDVVKVYVDDTTEQLKDLKTSLDFVKGHVENDLTGVKESLE
jgi:hypothetical protein